MRSVHKKHNKLVYLLKSGGERADGEWSLKRLNSLKWKERKGRKEAEREKERERRGNERERYEESMREREIDGGMSG